LNEAWIKQRTSEWKKYKLQDKVPLHEYIGMTLDEFTDQVLPDRDLRTTSRNLSYYEHNSASFTHAEIDAMSYYNDYERNMAKKLNAMSRKDLDRIGEIEEEFMVNILGVDKYFISRPIHEIFLRIFEHEKGVEAYNKKERRRKVRVR
jgi:hypothetical protein